jgi:hypothetical protein
MLRQARDRLAHLPIALPPTCGWLSLLQGFEQELCAQQAQKEQQLQLIPRASFSTDPLRGSYRNSGDERLDGILKTLDSYGYVRRVLVSLSLSL